MGETPAFGPGRLRQNAIYRAGALGRRPRVPTDPNGLERAARRAMSGDAWAYVAGGAGDGATMRANRAAFDRWALVPRMLLDVSSRDLSVSLLGMRLPAPLLVAPIGAAGLVPAAIIGDLDSLQDRAGWAARTRVIHLPEQITTDFQKVLRSTSAPVTLALGMTGKRLDHTLAALSAVLEFAPTRKLLLVDEVDVALAVVGSVQFAAGVKERVSIHPLVPIGFARSTGLLYPLDGLTLAPGALLGTSNEGVGGEVEIVPDGASAGTPYLLILHKARLWDLIGIAQA